MNPDVVTRGADKTAPLRIAVVSNTSWSLFNFRWNLIRELARVGHAVVAVAPLDEYSDKIKADGVVFAPVLISGSGTNPLTELKSVWALFKVFRRHRIDLVLSYT
ncbi:MAG: glycosyltransferase family 1 protein, partial [Stenotrophobium sp.]